MATRFKKFKPPETDEEESEEDLGNVSPSVYMDKIQELNLKLKDKDKKLAARDKKLAVRDKEIEMLKAARYNEVAVRDKEIEMLKAAS